MVELTFDRNSWTYKADGIVVPSVTKILGDARIIDYSAVPENILDFAKNYGTALHSLCQYYDDNDLDEEDIHTKLLKSFEAYKKFRKDFNFEIISQEVKVFSKKYRYAGTFDKLFIDENGDYGIIEIKSRELNKKYDTVQAIAYVMAINELGLGSIQDNLSVVFDKPTFKISRIICLALRKDGTYQFEEIAKKDVKQYWNIFLCCLSIYNWKRL